MSRPCHSTNLAGLPGLHSGESGHFVCCTKSSRHPLKISRHQTFTFCTSPLMSKLDLVVRLPWWVRSLSTPFDLLWTHMVCKQLSSSQTLRLSPSCTLVLKSDLRPVLGLHWLGAFVVISLRPTIVGAPCACSSLTRTLRRGDFPFPLLFPILNHGCTFYPLLLQLSISSGISRRAWVRTVMMD